MIDLGNGFFIVPTAYGYNLTVDKGQVDKKTGQKIYVPVSYHGSVASAVSEAMRERQRKVLSESPDCSLKEALEIMERIQKEFIEKLHEVVGSRENIGPHN